MASCLVLPILVHAFFEQAVLKREIGDDLFQGLSFPAKGFDFIRSGRPRRIARQAFLPGLQKLLGPANGMDGSPFRPQAESLELEGERQWRSKPSALILPRMCSNSMALAATAM